jgi:hypothetical protein
MPIGAFERASRSILAVLGKDAFLRGEATAHKVNIEHGVQVQDESSGLIHQRDIATIPTAALPRKGDTLSHPDGEYVIDKLYQDNGVNKRYVIVKA